MVNDRVIECRQNGRIIKFDLDLFEQINSIWGWSVKKNPSGYCTIRATKKEFKNKVIARLLLNCPEDKVVDHINGDSLDNRLANLRICTASQNAHNSAGRGASVSKGVFIKRGKFAASLTVEGKKVFIGTFNSVDAAKDAYAKAAKYHFGEFAYNGVK